MMTTIASSATAKRVAVPAAPLFGSRDVAAPGLLVVRLENLDKKEATELVPRVVNLPASFRENSIVFGDFRILPSARLLLKGDSPVNIGARAFDILAILVERAGEVVSNKEIEARAYAGVSVSEGALRFQISALRKALGDGGGSRCIISVNGRGYCFAASVLRSEEIHPSELAGSTGDLSSESQHQIDVQGSTQMISAAIADRHAIARMVSAIAPVAQSDQSIMVVFSLLGRRATLILDDPSPVGRRQ